MGDYSAEFKDEYCPPIVFERKSISDLYSTMGKGYPRFKREMIKAKELNLTLIIIIEGTLTKVLQGYKRSQIKGISMIYKLFTLWVRHGVMSVYCKDRTEMSEYITHTFISLGKQYVRRENLKITT